MNQEMRSGWRLQTVKATAPAIHPPVDRSIFACTLPSQRQPDKASIQGWAGIISSGAMPIVWNTERHPNQADNNWSRWKQRDHLRTVAIREAYGTNAAWNTEPRARVFGLPPLSWRCPNSGAFLSSDLSSANTADIYRTWASWSCSLDIKIHDMDVGEAFARARATLQ